VTCKYIYGKKNRQENKHIKEGSHYK